MNIQTVIILCALFVCEAKLPRFKQHIQLNELPSNPTQHEEALRLLQVEKKSEKTSKIVNQYKRNRREVFDSNFYESNLWAHSERLDEKGDVLLRWVNTDSSITFRLEARTLGYVGLGFNSVRNMRGADVVIAWVDDRHGNAQVLDCHGLAFEDRIVADEVQNYELISGYQNDTHTTVEFRRLLDTCDKQDFVISEDTTQVLWAIGPNNSDGDLPKSMNSNSRSLRFLQPLSKPDSIRIKQVNFTISNLIIPHNMSTMFWCKLFKVPDLPHKHHIVGYEPLIHSEPIRDGKPVSENSPSPVHHMVLYECAEYTDRRQWDKWTEEEGFFGPVRPAELATCVTPVAAWAMGSKGEFLPENVGIPIGEKRGAVYYMLEVHYDNQAHHDVMDHSGVKIYYTPDLRAHDAALFGTGVGVSALHVVPPKQRAYRTVGICSPECTNHTMPEQGINIVSVLLHAHGTARKIALKHIRGTEELPVISAENSYDASYQQSRIVPGGRRFFRTDTLITECTYNTMSKSRPTLGGYSASQEMCLSFVLYYPRTELAGCYSMTPVVEFFETFGVKAFNGISMIEVEKIFLSTGHADGLTADVENKLQANIPEEAIAIGEDDQGVALMKGLVISEPEEFRGKSFMAHLNEMAWSEPLLTEQIEMTLYKGLHMTFCKKRDDSWGAPIQINSYPVYNELTHNNTSENVCSFKSVRLPSITTTGSSSRSILRWQAIISILIMYIVTR